MKKIKIFITLCLTILSIVVTAQIPNSGFETWAGNDPNDWDNLNSLTSIAGIYTCTKGTPGNPGSSYIKLTTKTVPIIGIVPGVALSGKLDKTTFQPKSGFAYNQRPIALTGNWQYMAFGNDQGFIAVAFTKWNTITNIRDTISTTYYLLPGMVMSWESFSIPITFTNSSNPDTCLIALSASGLTTAVSNSYLYVDNLNFTLPSSVNENNNIVNNIKIYPNPAEEQLQIGLPNNTNIKLSRYKIINNLGQIVQISDKIDNFMQGGIKISNLPRGLYQLLIESAEKQYVTRFIKQ